MRVGVYQSTPIQKPKPIRNVAKRYTISATVKAALWPPSLSHVMMKLPRIRAYATDMIRPSPPAYQCWKGTLSALTKLRPATFLLDAKFAFEIKSAYSKAASLHLAALVSGPRGGLILSTTVFWIVLNWWKSRGHSGRHLFLSLQLLPLAICHEGDTELACLCPHGAYTFFQSR